MKNMYLVSANCVDFGHYLASSEQEARDLCAIDAGYKSEANMIAMIEQPSELIATILDAAGQTIQTVGRKA
jgi:hypothetical protein